jgi:hypothetical protein
MKLICHETGSKTHINDATDAREVQSAADRLVKRRWPGHFASFGSIVINNLGHITSAQVARGVGGLCETIGKNVTFSVVD